MSYGTVQAEKMTTESGYSLGAGNASSFKNRVINGAMVIDQWNNGAAVTSSLAYPVDRFIMSFQQSTLTAQRSSVAPAGFTNSLLFTNGTGVTPGAAEFNGFWQAIEANNIADLAQGTADAKPIVVSFRVRSSITGTYSGRLTNGNGLSYVFTYTIDSANTWEYKFVAIPGATTGTWGTGTSVGIQVLFDLGSGSNFNTTANAWNSGNLTRTSGSVTWRATTGATFYLTGLQLEVGTVATSFDFRSIGTELALCQRYLFTVRSTGAANGENVGMTGLSNGSTEMHRTNMALPVTMRAVPTISVSNISGVGTDLRVYNGSNVYAVTALGNQFSNINYLQADWTLAGSFTAGQYLAVLWRDSVSNGWIRANAEL